MVVVGPRREALAALLPAAAEEDAGHAAEVVVVSRVKRQEKGHGRRRGRRSG